jgi:hypothetical protein
MHDDPPPSTPLFSRSPKTEGQLFMRVLAYVGTGFDVEVADVVS